MNTTSSAIVLIDQIIEVIWFGGDNNISVNYNCKDSYTGTGKITITNAITQTITRDGKNCTLTFNENVSLCVLY